VDWEELFNKYDSGGHGEICYREFFDAMREGANVSVSMMSDQGLKGLFKLMDIDGGGTLDYKAAFIPWLEPDDTGEETMEAVLTPRPTTLKASMMADIRKKMTAAAYTNGNLQWDTLFKYYDRDNSGEMNFQEFKAAIRKSAKIRPTDISDEALEELFNQLDKDGGGNVEFSEFLGWLDPDGRGNQKVEGRGPEKQFEVLRKREARAHFEAAVAQTKRALMIASTDNGKVNLRKTWRLYDKKDKGDISFEDFLGLIRRCARIKPQVLSDASAKSLFKVINEGQDGRLSYEDEFLPWLGVELGQDEPTENTFSVAAAERKKAKALRKLVESKKSEIKERLTTAAYENGHVNFKKLFKHYDRDDTGDMNFQEFSLCIRKKAKITPQVLPDEALQSLFALIDTNGDGAINYENEILPWLDIDVDTASASLALDPSRARIRNSKGSGMPVSSPRGAAKPSGSPRGPATR